MIDRFARKEKEKNFQKKEWVFDAVLGWVLWHYSNMSNKLRENKTS